MSFIGEMFGMGGDPKAMQLPNFKGAANNAFQGNQDLSQYNTYGQVLPNIGNLTSQQANNPYAGAVQAGANGISPYGMNTGQGVAQGAGQFGELSNAIVPYASQILQNGFDPQNALYNRGAQQLTDQVRAGQAARGIATTPYGAGLENQAMSNFNLDWQDRQLGRQNSAIQGYGNAVQGGLQAGQGALDLANGGQQTYMNSAQLPYQTYNDLINNSIGAYGTYGAAGQNAAKIPGQQVGNWLSYVGQGNAGNQNALGQQKQNQNFFGDLINTVGSLFGLG